jgi:hypothetical protein
MAESASETPVAIEVAELAEEDEHDGSSELRGGVALSGAGSGARGRR